jgi:hypothetical protein
MRNLLLALAFLLAAPAALAEEPADEFFANLAALCGQAFEGEVLVAPEGDTTFTGKQLVMHVRECTDEVLYIPFHVGENRSRTWIITRTEDGLRLKHDHRYEDGSEEDLTQYGGDTAEAGTAFKQEFPADEFTAQLLPPAATNVWTVEIIPGETFVYALRREGTDRRFRIAFDLTQPVEPPPAPWGWE